MTLNETGLHCVKNLKKNHLKISLLQQHWNGVGKNYVRGKLWHIGQMARHELNGYRVHLAYLGRFHITGRKFVIVYLAMCDCCGPFVLTSGQSVTTSKYRSSIKGIKVDKHMKFYRNQEINRPSTLIFVFRRLDWFWSNANLFLVTLQLYVLNYPPIFWLCHSLESSDFFRNSSIPIQPSVQKSVIYI